MIWPFSHQEPPPPPRKNNRWASSNAKMVEVEAADGEVAKRKVKALNRSLRLALGSLQVLGSMPYSFDKTRGEYCLSWTSFSGLHMLATATWFTFLFSTTTYGLLTRLLFPPDGGCFSYAIEDDAAALLSTDRNKSTDAHGSIDLDKQSTYQTQLMGGVIIFGCLFNAWVEVLNGIRMGRRTCRLINTWLSWVATTGTEVTAGLRHFSVGVPIFVYSFLGALFFIVIFSSPRMVVQTGEALAQVMFLLPEQWLRPPSLATLVGLGLVIMHVFLVYKGAVVMFMTNCRLLANAFTTWRNQVARALQDVWSGQETAGVPLKELLEGHWRLVQLVRESEAIYSCMMMVYYASTVVMLCAELYLVAYRLGVGLRYSKEEAVCQTMIIGQTSVTFLLVSLSASAVHDEAEGSVDVVRRGLPYTASDSDKFHMRQLQLR
ncbi:uncharacterized protein [Panulirus ornatus]|uniref:uncharacterized protein isoform X3 n=1 Tax=Panulirus ornatus TaxID=150431 RepID=UPI003A83B81B